MNGHMKAKERWTELPPLVVGDHMQIQNQTGTHPTKWDKTCIVIEVCQLEQNVVRVDGSGRITTCNRMFLRRYIPLYHSHLDAPSMTIFDTSPSYHLNPTRNHSTARTSLHANPTTILCSANCSLINRTDGTHIQPQKCWHPAPYHPYNSITTNPNRATRRAHPHQLRAFLYLSSQQRSIPLAWRWLMDYNKKGPLEF